MCAQESKDAKTKCAPLKNKSDGNDLPAIEFLSLTETDCHLCRGLR